MPIAVAETYYGIVIKDENGNVIWEWNKKWPEGHGGRLYGLDVDPKTGNFYLGSWDTIYEINKHGEITWERTGYRWDDMHSVQFTPTGTLLATFSAYDKVYEIDKKKGIIWSWHPEDHYKMPDGYKPDIPFNKKSYHWTHLNHAWRLENGNTLIGLYNTPVSHKPTIYDDGIIICVDKDGEVLWEWGQGVTRNQHFVLPYRDGYVVADSGNNRVLIFKLDEGLIKTSKSFSTRVLGLDVMPNDHIIVSVVNTKQVHELDEELDVVRTFDFESNRQRNKIYQIKYLPEFVVDFTEEDEEIIVDRLKKMGYLE